MEKEGHSVPRQDIFDAYLQECKAHQLETTNQAAFGKLFKVTSPPRILAHNDDTCSRLAPLLVGT